MNLPCPEAAVAPPSVNGVALALPQELPLPGAELRQRAGVELLRQQAMRRGLLAADDPAPCMGAISEAAAAAIESLLEDEVPRQAPDDDSCRRYHAANAARFAQGERARLRHVLFAVTPGVDINALRRRAEECLIELRARSREEIENPGTTDRFADAARRFSNCPSGAQGGDLGWLEAGDCAPEFAREVFGRTDNGVLPRLVHSRFGLHVVEVLHRAAGEAPGYEAVQGAVQHALERQTFAKALREYLEWLAAQARVEGVDLGAADPAPAS